ncbi:hypothetical protein Cpir12675_000337 [Ceratocystis pirilliformis]|uniref:Uncharacterized protein n=1 Tax=Ceratocystis pirilliformis TaxID=259994 RepID=A0ABR3ZN89_9PEZI
MSAANNSTSASDVITYIGVPLAVLGVMPILYNTAVTLVVQSNIRQMLRNSKLEGVTRSDVFNRVIEIEIPRYAIKPCDRLRDREEYWSTSRSPSIIPGGSWMTLNWRKRLIGSRTQRVAYTDQVRQPQAEVAFDNLVSYLLDLGAVPEPEGWKILRSNGLWTPVGWDLMKGPSGQKALSIAPLDDSDGNLSLAIAWSSDWTTRDLDSLPPYWILLPPPILPLPKYEVAKEGVDGYGDGESTGQENSGELASSRAENSLGKKPEPKDKEVPQPNATIDTVQQQADANSTRAICCHVSSEGLVEAIPQANHAQAFPLPEPLYIDHLKASSTNLGGIWLASALTAYGVSSNTVLWNYKVPKEIVRLASSPLIPCGVLELLGIVDASQTPDWGTPDVSGQRSLERLARRSRDRVQVLARETQLSPQERMKAQTERMARERQEDFEQFISESAERRRFLDQRRREAFQSPKWAPSLLGDHMLAWLKARHHVPESATVKEATGQSLHGIVVNGVFAKKIFTILELWKDWAANAGMRKEDYDMLQADIESFAWAAVLVAVVSQVGEAVEGRLASDMQECLRMWKYVRLG